MSKENNWAWWAGSNEEEFNLAGPCATREDAIAEAYGDTEPGDAIFLVEAISADEEEKCPYTGLIPFTASRNHSHVIRKED
jgi:hypothetical protein